MGRKLVLTGTTLTDLTAPKLAEVDPLESSGSLLLVDPMHPAQKWAAGLPVATVPNLLAGKAQALIGTSLSVDPLFQTAGMTGTQGLLERSGKGGLHAIYSNTHATNTSVNASCHATLNLPQVVRDYLAANYSHEIFISVWSYLTRPAPAGQQPNAVSILGRVTSITANYKLLVSQQGSDATVGNTGRRSAPFIGASVGPKLNNVARATYSGIAPVNGNSSETQAYPWTVGNNGVMNSYLSAKQGVSSQILHRVYMEDLTASGRSYSAVDALDMEQYTKHVLTPGGRYYGDTFTDPATIP